MPRVEAGLADGRCAVTFDDGLEELDGLRGLRLVADEVSTDLARPVALVGRDDSIERGPRAADLAHERLLQHLRVPTSTRVDPRPTAIRLGREPFDCGGADDVSCCESGEKHVDLLRR